MARRLLLAVSDLLERVHGAPAGDQAGSVCKGSKCDADILYLSDVRVLTGICIERCNGDEPSEVWMHGYRSYSQALSTPGVRMRRLTWVMNCVGAFIDGKVSWAGSGAAGHCR
jgi:hypothetical protein